MSDHPSPTPTVAKTVIARASPQKKQASGGARAGGGGGTALPLMLTAATFGLLLFALDGFHRLTTVGGSGASEADDDAAFNLRDAAEIEKNKNLENDDGEVLDDDKTSAEREDANNRGAAQGSAVPKQNGKGGGRHFYLPPLCRTPRAERVKHLPTCMLPALNTPRPTGYDAWRADVPRRRAAWESGGRVGHPVTFPNEPPRHLLRGPLSLTYFRPPYYGQPGLTFNGSMAPEAFFAMYDESEWDEFCRAAGADMAVDASGAVVPNSGRRPAAGAQQQGLGSNDASDGAALRRLGAAADPRRGIVTPDKVTIGFIQDHGAWEEETITGQLVPPLFTMDRTRVKARREHRGPSATTEERRSDWYRPSAPKDLAKSFASVGTPSAAASDHPTVFAILLRYFAFLQDAPTAMSDLATTIACLRQHLALWYEEDVINSVFMSHEATMGFFMVHDRLVGLDDIKASLSLYEMTRRGEWAVRHPPAADAPLPPLSNGEAAPWAPANIDARNVSRLLFRTSKANAEALRASAPIGQQHEVEEHHHQRHGEVGNSDETTEVSIVATRDNFRRLQPLRDFMAVGPPMNPKAPFIFPQIRTIFSTSDEYAHHPQHCTTFADWVWGGAEDPFEADRYDAEHEAEARRLAAIEAAAAEGSNKKKVNEDSNDVLPNNGAAVVPPPPPPTAISEGKGRGLTVQLQSPERNGAPLPLPTTGRMYVRQYAYLPLNKDHPNHRLSLRQRRTVNQIMLSFRKFRRGVMTMRRVLTRGAGEGSVGYWGAADDIAINANATVSRISADGGSSAGAEEFALTVADAPLPRLADRRLHWAFFGELKRDRAGMNMSFSSLTEQIKEPHKCCSGDDIEADYGDTRFVPVGRGYMILDCSRIYEAAAAGAIPIIVSPSPDELVSYFGTYSSGGPFGSPNDWTGYVNKQQRPPRDMERFTRLPPFLYAPSWAQAAMLTYSLKMYPKAMEERRLRSALWFMNHYAYMQEALVYGADDGGIEEGKPIDTEFDLRDPKPV